MGRGRRRDLPPGWELQHASGISPEPNGCLGPHPMHVSFIDNKLLQRDNFERLETSRGLSMANVVPLAPPPAPDTPVECLHPALSHHGRRLAWLLTIALGLTVLFAVAILACGVFAGSSLLWLAPDAAFAGPPPPDTPGLVAFDGLPRATRWAYMATFLLDIIPVILVLIEARSCAQGFAAGIAFAAAAPTRMRRIALGLAAYALAPALGHGLVLMAGHGVDLAWFHASSLQALVLAVCLMALAEVVRIGHVIARDLDGFV